MQRGVQSVPMQRTSHVDSWCTLHVIRCTSVTKASHTPACLKALLLGCAQIVLLDAPPLVLRASHAKPCARRKPLGLLRPKPQPGLTLALAQLHGATVCCAPKIGPRAFFVMRASSFAARARLRSSAWSSAAEAGSAKYLYAVSFDAS
jgi:hypothetical protein